MDHRLGNAAAVIAEAGVSGGGSSIFDALGELTAPDVSGNGSSVFDALGDLTVPGVTRSPGRSSAAADSSGDLSRFDGAYASAAGPRGSSASPAYNGATSGASRGSPGGGVDRFDSPPSGSGARSPSASGGVDRFDPPAARDLGPIRDSVTLMHVSGVLSGVASVERVSHAQPDLSPGAHRQNVLGALGEQMGLGNPYASSEGLLETGIRAANTAGVAIEATINWSSIVSADYDVSTGRFRTPPLDALGAAREITDSRFDPPSAARAAGKAIDVAGKVDAVGTAAAKLNEVWTRDLDHQTAIRVVKLLQIEEGLNRWSHAASRTVERETAAGNSDAAALATGTQRRIEHFRGITRSAIEREPAAVVEGLRPRVQAGIREGN